MKTKTKFAAIVLGLMAGLTNVTHAGLVVTDLNHGVTPQDLANLLVGSAVSISNVTYIGSARGAGTFSGGLSYSHLRFRSDPRLWRGPDCQR